MVIIAMLFFFQRFGTKVVGYAFGPIMLVWFSLLFVLGAVQIAAHPDVLKCFNPWYAYELLDLPGGLLVARSCLPMHHRSRGSI